MPQLLLRSLLQCGTTVSQLDQKRDLAQSTILPTRSSSSFKHVCSDSPCLQLLTFCRLSFAAARKLQLSWESPSKLSRSCSRSCRHVPTPKLLPSSGPCHLISCCSRCCHFIPFFLRGQLLYTLENTHFQHLSQPWKTADVRLKKFDSL